MKGATMLALAMAAGPLAMGTSSAGAQQPGQIARDLAGGRLALDGLRFDAGDRPDSQSAASLRAVARAMRETRGGYVVKVRVTAPAHAQRTADRRAATIRLLLVADGVEAERLYSAGTGAVGVPGSHAEILRVK